MMKNYLVFFTALFLGHFTAISQTGPGGVGNSSNNVLWLDASQLGLTDGDSISSWTDLSGNNNHATQSVSLNKPIYRTSQVNGLAAVQFKGNYQNHLDLTSDITTNAISAFLVFQADSNQGWHGLVSLNNHVFFARPGAYAAAYGTLGSSLTLAIGRQSGYSIFSNHTGSTTGSDNLNLRSNAFNSNFIRTGFFSSPYSAIGLRSFGDVYHATGKFPEIIIYNEKLDSASRIIVDNYLAAKYNLSVPNALYSFKSTHRHELIGIGQEADGSNTSAVGTGRITISNASSLNNGDYLMIAHNNGGFSASTSTPNSVAQRWTQVYRVDETGNVGTIDVVIDFNGATLPSSDPNNYVLLIDNDGNFANGGTTIVDASSVNIGALTVTYNGVDFSNGNYFTLGEKVGDINSTADGQWDQTSTWNCGCIPTNENNVEINHIVTIDANAAADDVNLNSGRIEFTGSDTLNINGDFTIMASFIKGTGTIQASSTVFQQTFSNATASAIELHNLYVSSTDPLILSAGDWEIGNNLQISSGGLDVSATNSVSLTSDASSISQILSSIDNPYTGNLTLQRHISSRNANYSNFSSPIEGATFAQLDDDLFLSGLTGGGDGNATTGSGKTFYSVYSYDGANSKHDTVTNVTDPMTNGMGYEIFLASTLSSYSGGVVDYVGTPNSGDVSITIERGTNGFNLIGNPYHSYINFDNLDQANIGTTFYIYSSVNGSYSTFNFGSNTLIAPSQGFWVVKDTPGSDAFTFQENDKSESHLASFHRKASPDVEELKLNIREVGSELNQDLIVKFNPNAHSSVDEYDALYLPSPHKEVPAITAKVKNNNNDYIVYGANNIDLTQIIPLEIKSGKKGDYLINAEGIQNVYKSYDCFYLEDKAENKIIDLSVEPSYAFSSEEGSFNRFELVISKDYLSCQKAIDNDVSSIQQIEEALSLRNNMNGWWMDYSFTNDYQHQLELRVYNLSGQEVIAPISYNVSGSGTMQLNQLQELSGIYVIQIVSEGEILNKTVQL